MSSWDYLAIFIPVKSAGCFVSAPGMQCAQFLCLVYVLDPTPWCVGFVLEHSSVLTGCQPLVNDHPGAMEDSRGLSEVPLPTELGMGLCSGWCGRELGWASAATWWVGLEWKEDPQERELLPLLLMGGASLQVLLQSVCGVCMYKTSWVCVHTYPKARLVSQNSLSYYFLSSSSLMQSACMGTQRALDLPGAWQRS